MVHWAEFWAGAEDEETTVKTADKRFKRALHVVLGFALVGVALPGVGEQNQTAPNVKEQFTPLIRSVEGPDLFRAYCTPCHGVDAKGGVRQRLR